MAGVAGRLNLIWSCSQCIVHGSMPGNSGKSSLGAVDGFEQHITGISTLINPFGGARAAPKIEQADWLNGPRTREVGCIRILNFSKSKILRAHSASHHSQKPLVFFALYSSNDPRS